MNGFLFLHIAGGSLAVVGGYAALFAPKGNWLHRRAGMLFVYAMIAMGIGAMVVGLARGKSTWMGGPMVIYLVGTGMLAVRRTRPGSRTLDIALIALAVAMGLLSLYGGIRIFMDPRGPLGIKPGVASMVNALVLLLCVSGDVRVLRFGPPTGTKRLVRHLWRMCYAMFIATGSFFLGQAQVIPQPLRYWPMLTVLAFLPLAAMFYWMWRVRRRPPRSVTRIHLAAPSQTAA